MTRVFISHSNLDDDNAADLKSWLGPQGFEYSVLEFDKHSGSGAGDHWEYRLHRELEKADALIVILTSNWLKSKWCFAEFTQARALGKPIFPVIDALDADTTIAPDVDHIDLTKDREAGLRKLSAGLTGLSLSAHGQFSWDPGRPPYPGLRALQDEDAAVCFGRDDDIRQLIERLNATRVQGGRRLIAMIGASGTGKSSFLCAGVVPRLRRDASKWIALAPFRPMERPLDELAGVLASAMGEDIDAADIRQRLTAKDFGLAFRMIVDDLRARRDAFSAYVVVAIDRAEELFAVSPPEETAQFLHGLNSILSTDMPVLVIMSLKSDSVGALQRAEQLAPGFDQFHLEPLPPARIQQVIEGPARVAGFKVDPGLVARVKQDAATEDALPLLAVALHELHKRAGPGGQLSVKDYEDLGDADGHRSPLQNALCHSADAVLEAAAPSDKDLSALRKAFVPSMAEIGGDGRYVSRPAKWSTLPQEAHGLLEKLADAGLLAFRQNGDERIVEVTHDALLRRWPRLSAWLEEGREFYAVKSQLERDAADWRRAASPADKDAALLKTAKLNRVREWLKLYPQHLSDTENQFISASIERERLKQRALMRGQLQSVWRRMLSRAAMGGLAVAAVLFAVVAWQWFVALDAKRDATALREAAETARQAADASAKAANAERQAAEAAKAELEQARGTAQSEQAVAKDEQSRASRQRDAALATQNRHLGGLSALELRAGNTVIATLLGLEATGDGTGDADPAGGVRVERNLFHAATALPEQVTLLRGRGRKFTSSRFSPDGSRLLTMGENQSSIRLWDLTRNGALLEIADTQGQPINAAKFSADGRRLVTASSSGLAQVWDARTGLRLLTLSGHTQAVTDAAFSRDGARIATASRDGTARVWDARSGAVLATLTNIDGQPQLTRSAASNSRHGPGPGRAAKVAFGPDGLHVLTVSDVVGLWEVESGDNIQSLKAEGYYAYFENAEISPDGTRVVAETGVAPEGALYATAYGPHPRMQFWDIESGLELTDNGIAAPARDPKGPTDPASFAAPWLSAVRSSLTPANFSADGSRLIAPYADGTAHIWDTKAGGTIGVLNARGAVKAARFSGDGSRILTVTAKPSLMEVWDARTLSVIAVLESDGAAITDAVFSPDGFQVAVTYDDGTLRVWRMGQPWTLAIKPRRSHPPFDAVLSPDGSQILAISKHGAAHLYDAETGVMITTVNSGGEPVTGAAFSPDGRSIVLATGKVASVWDARTSEKFATFKGHSAPITSVRFTSDGKRVVSVGAGSAMHVWDPRSSEKLSTVNFGYRYRTASISGDGTRFLGVISESSSKADLWDVTDRAKVAELRTTAFWRNFAALAQGGRLVGDLSQDGSLGVLRAANTKTLSVWNAGTGAALNNLTGHSRAVRGVSISPNGERILTASEDGTARLWSAKTGREIVVYRGHSDYVNSVAFSTKGNLAATTSDDGTIRVWPSFQTTGALVGHAREAVPRCLTREEREAFFLTPEPPEWCITMRKRPYHTNAWRQWLADKAEGKTAPMPQ
ncbi:MAG: TIR domain-containing protein [Hyphomicrobiales bacterium]